MLVTALCACLSTTATVTATVDTTAGQSARAQPLAPPDPRLAFENALARLNASAPGGQPYALSDVRVDAGLAFATAQPAPATSGMDSDTDIIVPMIGLLDARDKSWTVILPLEVSAEKFNALLWRLPATLIDEQTKARLEQPVEALDAATRALLSAPAGHRLPAPYNRRIVVTTRDGSTHLSQVDFVTRAPYAGDVVASKPGKVVFVKQSSTTGKCDFAAWQQANLIVIEHAPNEFSWYYHLAHNSALVHVGDTVNYGTRLGLQGATGYACGAHVHYMVSTGHTSWTDPNNPNAAPWAIGIVPVDFAESAWKNLTVGLPYTSQNRPNDACLAPAIQPLGDWVVTGTHTLKLSWAGIARCAYTGYQVRLKDTPNMDAGGTTIIEATTSGLSATITVPVAWNYRDLYFGVRAANALDASWSVRKLRIEPPIPGQYTLYSDANFVGNAFTARQVITNLGTLKLSRQPRSLTLDAGVGVLICDQPNFKGSCARAMGPRAIGDLNTLAPGLASYIASIRACAGPCPSGPAAPTLTYPVSGQVVYSGTAVAAEWLGDLAASGYQAEFSGGALSTTLTVTLVLTNWAVVSLAASGPALTPITPAFVLATAASDTAAASIVSVALDAGAVLDTAGNTVSLLGALAPSSVPYQLRVRSSNDFGESDWGQVIFAVTPTVPIPAISPPGGTNGMNHSVFLPVLATKKPA